MLLNKLLRMMDVLGPGQTSLEQAFSTDLHFRDVQLKPVQYHIDIFAQVQCELVESYDL